MENDRSSTACLNSVMESNSNKKFLLSEKIKTIFGTLSGKILEDISHPRCETFRIIGDTNQTQIIETLREFGFEIINGPIPNSYINKSSLADKKISRLDNELQKRIYIQGLSSMMDTVALSPKIEDKVLDICASPGSKTTQLASIGVKQENIFAVENNTSRFHSLKRNVTEQGFSGIDMIKANAVGITERMPYLIEYFDKIIVDVPCSNEGNIRFCNENWENNWNPKLSKKISMLQKRILSSAYYALKPGGSLVYSTCTYSPLENESVVDWALRKFNDLVLKKIELPIDSGHFIRGFPDGEKYHRNEMINTVRILPNEYYDGFFIALLQRQPAEVSSKH